MQKKVGQGETNIDYEVKLYFTIILNYFFFSFSPSLCLEAESRKGKREKEKEQM